MNLMYLLLFAFCSYIFAFAFVLTSPSPCVPKEMHCTEDMSHQSGRQERGEAEEDTKGIPDEETQEEGMPSGGKRQRKRRHDDEKGQTREETHVQGGRRGSKRFSWWKQITKR